MKDRTAILWMTFNTLLGVLSIWLFLYVIDSSDRKFREIEKKIEPTTLSSDTLVLSDTLNNVIINTQIFYK